MSQVPWVGIACFVAAGLIAIAAAWSLAREKRRLVAAIKQRTAETPPFPMDPIPRDHVVVEYHSGKEAWLVFPSEADARNWVALAETRLAESKGVLHTDGGIILTEGICRVSVVNLPAWRRL